MCDTVEDACAKGRGEEGAFGMHPLSMRFISCIRRWAQVRAAAREAPKVGAAVAAKGAHRHRDSKVSAAAVRTASRW